MGGWVVLEGRDKEGVWVFSLVKLRELGGLCIMGTYIEQGEVF